MFFLARARIEWSIKVVSAFFAVEERSDTLSRQTEFRSCIYDSCYVINVNEQGRGDRTWLVSYVCSVLLASTYIL